MQLQHIALSRLTVSDANMRAGKKPPDLDDLLPSIRLRGVLVPLIVRPRAEGEGYEIVAGRRRFLAASLAAEDGKAADLPCAIMDAGDDAAALEASILENVARAEPHEVEQWVSFTRLVKEGRSAEEIGLVFGLTERQVGQVLALGNLLPKIRDLYRAGDIDGGSVKLLTMATKAQQKDWLALLADKERYAPMGASLKSWLFGGASIATAHAIFDLETYPHAIVTDLFGDGGYFADAGAFWDAQRAAIEEKRQAYLGAGWSEVVVLEPGQYFPSWDYERTAKSKGGKVYIAVSQRGEVAFHEGYLTRKDARRLAAGEGPSEAKPQRSEVTGSLQNYIDLHRHAAVRADLLGAPDAALRLMAAHVLAGSYLFAVRPEPQRSSSDAIAESIETSPAETRFDAERRELLALLDLDAESPTLIQTGAAYGSTGTAELFVRLLALDDAAVMRVVALAMGEALAAGSAEVEALSLHLGLDMRDHWQADDAFIDLIRDREVLTPMIADMAGNEVAEANRTEKVKAQKAILSDCLAGANGRAKVEGWVPRWMQVPPSHYTERGGAGTVRHHAEVAHLFGAEEAEAAASPPAPEEGEEQVAEEMVAEAA
ncbi:ParB/RepB/Spo0J family partition protein [Sphingomonas sabuli]|uniref:ParB/RepB/Spo0J family partition protein n=1 Tax=Sphingomonas sabuli TaxID=2764186 RepID=A0A7G9L3Y9_9SPHN|nr:ParB/RepB/Spo0J family partition protein [Sphingomonas sabuli]QNM83338.1 ParB/RepB/Spo0J family partition protein [Sphingomonas sabuli]